MSSRRWCYIWNTYLWRLISTCGRTSWQKKRVNFDPDTKTKSFSTPTLKPNKFRSLHWNQVKFDRPHWNRVNFDHPHKNQVSFDVYTITKRFAARIQTKSIRPPKQNPSQSITLKTCQFRPVHSISTPRTKHKSISIPTLKPSQIRSPTHKNQGNFDATT